MDKTQLLERYYNTFINLTNPRDFFIGMTDYLDYANSVSELTTIADDVSAPKNALTAQLEAAQKVALAKLATVKDELFAYVSKHKIDDRVVNEAFQGYDGWLQEKIAGSHRLPDALHDALRDVVEFLHKLPEHMAFAEQYIEFSQDKTYIRHYLPLAEYSAFREVAEEIENESKTALWAQLDEVSTLYQTIKTGRAKLKGMVEELKKSNKNPLTWQLLNYKVLIDDWRSVEHGTGNVYFFKIDKIKPMLMRLHNYLVSRLILGPTPTEIPAHITTETTVSKLNPRLVAKKSGKGKCGFLQLYEGGKQYKIAGIGTRQFLLVQCLFSSENKVDTAYLPTFHTYESVYEAIRLPKDKTDGRFFDSATKDAAIRDKIEWAIKEIQKNKQVRGYLKFDREMHRMQMQITLPEGNEK